MPPGHYYWKLAPLWKKITNQVFKLPYDMEMTVHAKRYTGNWAGGIIHGDSALALGVKGPTSEFGVFIFSRIA